ncbi:MAG: hypothetical protein U0Q18_16075 [Bryobacteraceae bacterium]
MHRLSGVAALLGLGTAVVVHVATALGIDVCAQLPAVWLLHFGAILIFGAFVLSARTRQIKLANILDRLPAWVLALFGITVAYVVVNSFFSLHISGDGSAEKSGGQYVLMTHGRLLAYLTEKEFHTHRAAELRFFSGGWLLFYAMPAIYFLMWQQDRGES